MSDTRYEVRICWSDEDEAYVAVVPELPGCAADGLTREQALANAEVAIEQWISTARELERAVPAPRSRIASVG